MIVLPFQILSSGHDYSRLSTGELLKKLKGVCAAGEGRWVSAYWAPGQVAKAELDKSLARGLKNNVGSSSVMTESLNHLNLLFLQI